MTSTRHQVTTDVRETSELAIYIGQDELCEGVAGSLAAVARMLAYLRGRACSHPDRPATGLYPMSDEYWRACITELRRRRYHITESVATQGDRAANEIGYTLAGEPPSTGPFPFVAIRRRVVQSPPPSWSVDRSPSRAT